MKTLGQVIKLSSDWMHSKNPSVGRLEVEWLIAGVLKMKRLDLYLNFEKPLQEGELEQIRVKLKRLAEGEPLQYIEGQVHFFGCTLKVDRRVLIPRPETEHLVELIAKTLKTELLQGKTLLDIGTGSGCIAISLKKAFPELRVLVSDTSKDALSSSFENAALNQVEIVIDSGNDPLDYVVSNPPYISEEEFPTLETKVKDFEPKCALVSGQTGLEVYQAIAPEIRKRLNTGGKGWFEIGATQAKSVQELLHQEGFKHIQLLQDLSQRDRYISFSL